MKSVTVHADVKFHSQMPFTNVDVCFQDQAQLQRLIDALTTLLVPGTPPVRIVLADPASYLPEAPPPEVDSLPTGVTFNPLDYRRDEIELRCLAAARSQLESLCT